MFFAKQTYFVKKTSYLKSETKCTKPITTQNHNNTPWLVADETNALKTIFLKTQKQVYGHNYEKS